MCAKHGWRFRLTLCVLGLGLVVGHGRSTAAGETVNEDGDRVHAPSLAYELAKLREGLGPLDFGSVQADSSAAAIYFDYYNLRSPEHDHRFGAFRSGTYVLAAHAYRPHAPRGTVIVMHGYLDHTGTLSSTIHHLLAQGYAVAAYDQPGHGLSTGPRATIDEFAHYARAFAEFLRLCRAHMPPPYHALAHSTGATILVDRLLSQEDGHIERVVLIAPLVRSAHWHLSTFVTPILDVFVDDLPRMYRENSSDERFLDFVRHDPLQSRRAPLAWFKALVEWNERVEAYAPSPRAVSIVQGDADLVVDWRYNVKLLRTKFPRARVHIIQGGRHQLLNEAPTLRREVLKIVDEELGIEEMP